MEQQAGLSLCSLLNTLHEGGNWTCNPINPSQSCSVRMVCQRSGDDTRREESHYHYPKPQLPFPSSYTPSKPNSSPLPPENLPSPALPPSPVDVFLGSPTNLDTSLLCQKLSVCVPFDPEGSSCSLFPLAGLQHSWLREGVGPPVCLSWVFWV